MYGQWNRLRFHWKPQEKKLLDLCLVAFCKQISLIDRPADGSSIWKRQIYMTFNLCHKYHTNKAAGGSMCCTKWPFFSTCPPKHLCTLCIYIYCIYICISVHMSCLLPGLKRSVKHIRSETISINTCRLRMHLSKRRRGSARLPAASGAHVNTRIRTHTHARTPTYTHTHTVDRKVG